MELIRRDLCRGNSGNDRSFQILMPVTTFVSNTMTTSFPPLPTELVLHILRLACHTSHHTALSISLLASWVRSAVLPFVFSTVVRRAGPTLNTASSPSPGWATPQYFRPSTMSLHQRSYAHLLPPTTCDVGKFVRRLWIETIDMMSSPGELSIFNACTNIEDVALSASSLRMLYNSTLFGKKRSPTAQLDDQHPIPTDTMGAASRIRSVTLTKHTFRYDWHFLVDLHSASAGTHVSLLGNITHLRLTDMEKSPYIPIEYLPNLTHLALPYLQLRANHRGDTVRIPDLVLQADRPTVQSQRGPHPPGDGATLETTPSKLVMIVLTVDEGEWLFKPWRHGAHAKEDSPRGLFESLREHARERDGRIHVVLSPRVFMDVCSEWAGAARGNNDNVWEVAQRSRAGNGEQSAADLPLAFPRLM